MALARTRQAVAVHRAIGFMSTANTARAMVELRRALHENSACRAPLVNVQHEARQLSELYRMHLQNSPVPADFAVLLQLRCAPADMHTPRAAALPPCAVLVDVLRVLPGHVRPFTASAPACL
jgi:hypothetical protein